MTGAGIITGAGAGIITGAGADIITDEEQGSEHGGGAH
jgi:hypothetical protein